MAEPAKPTNAPSGALAAALALVEAFAIDAGQITIVVQHPRTVAYIDANRRFKPEELAAAS